MNNNNDAVKSAVQRVNEMSNNNANRNFQKYDNYKAKVDAIVTLEDVDNINKLVSGAENLAIAINKSLKGLEDSSKEYKQMSELYNTIVSSAKDLSNENNDASKNAKIIVGLYKSMQKSQGSMSKQAIIAAKEFLDANQEALDIANEFKTIMGKSSETFGKNLKNNLVQVKDELRNIANAFNLQKLVTGGLSVNDLRKMQSNVQISMNLDQSGFMGVQSQMIEQNKQIIEQTGEAYMTFNDAVSYMSSIKEYNVKNYNQASAMYKQITLGTKYLSISNQNLGSLVKAQNAIADEQAMSRQMALLSALGTDNGLAENMDDLASFIGENLENVNSRYANANDIMMQSTVIKSVADAYLGSNSKQVSALMGEIMSKSDFSQLSDRTQTLLNMTGATPSIQAMMRSGNLDMNYAMNQVLTGLYNRSGDRNFQNVMDMYGLSDFVNIGQAYAKNYGEIQNQLNSQMSLTSSAKSVEELEALLMEQNDTRTFLEKFGDKVTNSLGLQNQNWKSILGIGQGISAIINTMSGIISGMQLFNLIAINRNTAISAGKSDLGDGKMSNFLGKAGLWLSSKSMGFNLLGPKAAESGIGTLSNAAGLTIAGTGLAIGVGMGLNDAQQMKDSKLGSLGGFFLGTGHKEQSTGEKVGSVLGNTGKYAAIGAAVGTIIPGLGTIAGGLIGGALGLITGGLGAALNENTEAVESNTEGLKSSSDSIANNSGMSVYYKSMLAQQEKNGGSGGVSYGTGSGGISNNYGKGGGSYPWTVTSGYGWRTNIVNGKEVTDGSLGFHHGIDFGIPQGTKIGSATAGTVTFKGWYGGGGNTVLVKGTNGLTYKYMHQMQPSALNVGDAVKAGDLIGYSGTTGNSTGPHLHLQVDQGTNETSRNPEPYITPHLFSADGKQWTGNATAGIDDMLSSTEVSGVVSTLATENSKSYVTKDAVFSPKPSNVGGKGGDSDNVYKPNYATSDDINRLIEVIQNLNDTQQEQRQFMQALSGKNTFVFGR